MHTMNPMPAAAASRIAADAALGGTATNDAVAPVAATASATDVEDRDALDVLAALAGRDAADDLGAVVPVAQAVVLALPAGEALDDDLGVLRRRRSPCQFLRSRSAMRDGCAGGLEHGRLADRSLSAGMPASSRIWRPSSALVPSRRITIGARRSTRPSASTMPLATSSPRVMPPKMLMKIALHVLVEVDDLERGGHHVGVGAAADVEEVGGRAADLVDDVERAHRQAGAVGDDADRCRRGRCTAGPSRLASCSRSSSSSVARYSSHSGWRNAALLSRLTLASRACTSPVGLEDQRVDLGQVAVALGEAAVQLDEDVGDAVDAPRRRSWRRRAAWRAVGQRRARRPGRCGA